MPSPVAHALGGLAAAFIVDSVPRRPTLTVPILVGSVALAVAPDLDLLTGSHRTHTHSIGAVAIIGVICWVVLRSRSRSTAAAAALIAAYASHLLLDWLSKDTRPPSGIPALWPFTAQYYQSPLTVFGETSRRYWLPEEFVLGNLRSLGWDLTVLVPLLIVAWVHWSRSTLESNIEERKSNTTRVSR
jgi:inner membrane protein